MVATFKSVLKFLSALCGLLAMYFLGTAVVMILGASSWGMIDYVVLAMAVAFLGNLMRGESA